MTEATIGRRRRPRSEEPVNTEGDAPRAGRRRTRETAQEESRSSRRREEPSSSRRSSGSTTRSGWKAFSERRQESTGGDFVTKFKIPDEETIIKFLDSEPFDVYEEHWVDEAPGKRKSFPCLAEESDGCPLCDVGERARVYALFNIVDLGDPDNPVSRPWRVSQTVTDTLERLADDKKSSPLNREDLYFSVYKTGGGKKGPVVTHISPVKERDLDEDWDISPLDTADIEEFEIYTESDVYSMPSWQSLKDIADVL